MELLTRLETQCERIDCLSLTVAKQAENLFLRWNSTVTTTQDGLEKLLL